MRQDAVLAVSRGATFCENELGDSTVEHPGALRKQIREALIDSGVLEGMPAQVSGAQGTTGVLEAWPKVVKNRSDFVTVRSSKTMPDGLDYFYNLELSAITLAVNYWRWEGRSEAAIKSDIDAYDAVAGQRKVYSALPQGVLIRPRRARGRCPTPCDGFSDRGTHRRSTVLSSCYEKAVLPTADLLAALPTAARCVLPDPYATAVCDSVDF